MTWRTMQQAQHQEGEGDGTSGQSGAGTDANTDGAVGQGSAAGVGDGQSSAAGDWRASLGTDLAKEKLFDTVKAADAATALPLIAKLAADNHRMVGASIQLPKKDATPAEVAKWREVQGPKLIAAGLVPAPVAKASDYVIEPPKDVKGLPEMSESRKAYWQGAFHKAGLSQAQADALIDAQAAEIGQGLQLLDEGNQAKIDEVRGKWGDALFDRRWALANRSLPLLAESVGLEPKAVAEYLDATRKGNDPILFQLLAAVGEMVDEDSLGVEASALGVGGAEDAKQRIEAIRANKQHPWHNVNHPEHQKATDEMNGLYKLAFGAKAPA